ncbi:MAG: class I SAM-dependent methyltransferase [Acidiferrobacterales bacterium]
MITSAAAHAIGKRSRTIIDATAGLGHDALLLALMGYEVTAIERSPIIAALLRDGIMRAQEQEKLAPALGDRFMLLAGDARKLLPTLETCADVIYLDPMYPPSAKRSALPKKVMRTLRDIVGDDADTGELLSVALKHAQGRVVVKRPSSAMPISTPSTSYRGKMVRYDVYITPA